MCIQTRIQKILAEKEALDVQLQKLDQLETKTAPVKTLLSELLADYSDVAPEELPQVWGEILAIGSRFNLSGEILAADELKAWEVANAKIEQLHQENQETIRQYLELTEASANRVRELQAELEKLKMAAGVWQQQLEEAQAEITEQDRAWGELSDERDDLEKEVAELRSQFEEYQTIYNPAPTPDLTPEESAEVVKRLTDFAEELQAQRQGMSLFTDEEALTGAEYDAAVEEELALDDTEEKILAVTLWQPWATLIAQGDKKIETRSWSTSHRGAIAIHAAKRSVDWSTLNEDEYTLPEGKDWPLGAVVAIANLVDCVEMTPEFIAAQTQQERQLGVWQPGRFAWVLENVQLLDPPVPTKGGQKLWLWDGIPSAAEPEVKNESESFDEEEIAEQNINGEDCDSKFKSADKQWNISVTTKKDGGLMLLYQGKNEGFTEKITKEEWEKIKAAHKTWTKRGVLGDYTEKILQSKLKVVDNSATESNETGTRELTELQKLLTGNSNFTFKDLGVSVAVQSVIAPADDTVDFDSEEALITVTDSTGETREYYLSAQIFVHEYNDVRQSALGYAQYFLSELRKDAETKEKIARWNADQTLTDQTTPEPITDTEVKLGDRLTNGSEFAIVSLISKKDAYLKRESGGSICLPASELKTFGWELSSKPTAEPVKPETKINFMAMGFEVIVYPQYANENLVGATFRFLSLQEKGADGKAKLVFSTSRLAVEIGDRTWKICAYDLIQDYRDKEATRLEKLANPHAKEEDKFVELVKISNAVAYLKRRDTGEILKGYAAFSARNEEGEKLTFAKPRAQKWAEYLRNNNEASEEGKNSQLVINDPRKSKRLVSDNPKQVFTYEITISGCDLGYLERLAQLDLSVPPNEQRTKKPSTAKSSVETAPIFKVKVNSYEVASGTEKEMRLRFDEEVKTLGAEGRTEMRLVCGNQIIEGYLPTDFSFVPAQDFDEANPEYFVLHRPTKYNNFRVYRSLASGSDWINSIYPYRPNLFATKEAAAVDAVRRQLKAEAGKE